MLRFGLAGYGLWGKHHARAIQACPDTRLAAIACASESTAAQAKADHPDVPVVIGHEALLALPEIDAIDIVVPNHLHARVALAALAAGKDVLLEKPLALSEDDCAQLIAAERRSGRTLSVVHQFRLSTQWGRIKAMVDAGDIGEPLYANISLFRFPFRPGSGRWRYDRKLVGSWVLEEPVHFFDSVMWYFESLGDPISVTASATASADAPGLHANFSCVLHWPGGAYATITQSLSGFENHQVIEIVGTAGSVRGWWSGASDRTPDPVFELKARRRGSDTVERLAIGPSGEVVELEATFASIGAAFAHRRALVSATAASKSVAVCLAAERALTTHGPVALAF